MKLLRVLFLFCAVASMAACGGTPDLTCADPRPYEAANEGQRIEVPEGLNSPDKRLEMPLPDASPRAARPAGSPCLDMPPGSVVE